MYISVILGRGSFRKVFWFLVCRGEMRNRMRIYLGLHSQFMSGSSNARLEMGYPHADSTIDQRGSTEMKIVKEAGLASDD